MRTVLAILIVVAPVACSGTAGVRDHAEALVVATHCQGHACPTTPQARGLGDGCYVVDDALYQCSTDERPAGEASCFEIPRCAGACEVTITDGYGREISTERCRDRGRADRDAHRPPPTCGPAQLRIAIDAAPAGAPTPLPLPAAVVLDVIRSGKSRVLYAADACATDDGVAIREATHATGFAALDQALGAKLEEISRSVAVPSGACWSVTLVVSNFECETEQSD